MIWEGHLKAAMAPPMATSAAMARGLAFNICINDTLLSKPMWAAARAATAHYGQFL